jgi:FtsP/CotA-like multicopper oxidase with cupredoxin domain
MNQWIKPCAIGAAAWMCVAGGAAAADLQNPFTLNSVDGVLDILMVAKAASVPTLAPFAPTGWVYQICRRADAIGNECPTSTLPVNYYGGTDLQLNPGDTLRIRLVNELPMVTDSKHASEPGEEFLRLNPTNIHTHGLIVSTHTPTATDPTYGDNVFVLTFNPANGQAAPSPHMHSDVRYGYTDYAIQIPADHPPGVYWFHPHAHGLALNQVSAGLTGIITVGNVGDYVCTQPGCGSIAGQIDSREFILKDMQVLPVGTMHDQEAPDFCQPATLQPPGASLGQGSCPGQDQSANGGDNYTGGRWYFTINGMPYPNVPITAPGGEIWRIVNTSGSATYDLQLWNADQQREMVMQVLSVDGVSVSPPAGTTQQQFVEIAGQKLQPVACPGLQSPNPADPSANEPLCTNRLHLMPSSRAEVWVTYRDATGAIVAPPGGASAVLRTAGFNTGPGGDSWPPVDLASVQFRNQSTLAGAVPALKVKGFATALKAPLALAADLHAVNAAVGSDPTCAPLPAGHMRRIFFNVPTLDPSAFGLGYEEIDANGNPVPGTFQDVAPFDPARPTVCVPLGPGNTPAMERWQLVNLANEDHNFHVHQTHFRVLSAAEVAGTAVPGAILGDGVMLDNVPLSHADGVCNSVQDWRNAACTAHPAVVEIPFTVAGDFVYHCHILEHEDGGMMARIRVRANPK